MIYASLQSTNKSLKELLQQSREISTETHKHQMTFGENDKHIL